MAFFHYKNVRVAGISAGVPSHVEDNLHSQRKFSPDYDNAAFVELTGVRTRRFDMALTTSDLCFAAAKRLMADLRWEPSSVDAIIVVSQTLDYILPATACIMQDRLGLSKEAFAEDVQLGCSGWVYGMGNIASLLQTGDIKRALLCAGDARGHSLDESKADPLFGFAGTVTALEYEEGNEGIKAHYGTDGSGYEAIITPAGGSRIPFDKHTLDDSVDQTDGKVKNMLTTRMNGMDVFSFGITTAPKSVKRLADKFGFDYLGYDWFVFHQANKKMNQMIVKKLKLDQEKVPSCMEDFGNTSSASIPLTIVTRLAGKGSEGKQNFICCGFGVGLSWGTLAFSTENLVISPLVEVNSDEHLI